MNFLLLFSTVSFKKELRLLLLSLALLVSLPVITLLSATNVAALTDSGVTLYSGPMSVVDTYDFGNCTYWAALLRLQAGIPIPNTWGNANTWDVRAAAAGYVVDHQPDVDAIMQTSAGQYGHVAFVTGVDTSSGNWTISEMNYKGFDEIDSRTLPASAAVYYRFIH